VVAAVLAPAEFGAFQILYKAGAVLFLALGFLAVA